MVDEANHAGTYVHPHYAHQFPGIQMITIGDLLAGKKPNLPPTMLPYVQAQKGFAPQAGLFEV